MRQGRCWRVRERIQMSLKKLFQSAVEELRARKVKFAVAGGFAAALYRLEPRLTMDVDLTILSEAQGQAIGVAVLKAIGLEAGIARQADLAGGPLFAIRRKSTPPCIIVGRTKGEIGKEGIDILLPSIPWVPRAVERAQANEVDFGFGPVPTLSLEDVILSKLYALNGAQLRAKDLDDLQCIFEAGHAIDEAYIAGQMDSLDITIPREAKPLLPQSILQLVKDSVRSRRSRSK